MTFDWQTELDVPVFPSSTAQVSPSVVAPPKPLSFAQSIKVSQVQFTEPLPTPLIRGDTLSIKITHETFVQGLEPCKVNLRGRLVLNKGDTPYSSKDIVAKLHKLLKTAGQ